MADESNNVPRRSRTGRLRDFNRARWRKWSKYTISGLAFIIAGLLVLIFGILLYSASSYQGGFLIGGAGVILVLVGVIRLLIGFINPAIPEDLRPLEEEENRSDDEVAVDDNTA